MKSGVELIAKERERQIKKEGFTKGHDVHWVDGELADAAVCYALEPHGGDAIDFIRRTWPFDKEDFKLSCIGNTSEDVEGRVHDLVKAGALIAAEIDRLQRLKKIKK